MPHMDVVGATSWIRGSHF